MELGRTVAKLEKELAASREAEEALKAEAAKLASFQTFPDQVENLTKQVGATKTSSGGSVSKTMFNFIKMFGINLAFRFVN